MIPKKIEKNDDNKSGLVKNNPTTVFPQNNITFLGKSQVNVGFFKYQIIHN